MKCVYVHTNLYMKLHTEWAAYAIMCWFGHSILLADAIEVRGFLKINVMKSVGKQFKIIKKQ